MCLLTHDFSLFLLLFCVSIVHKGQTHFPFRKTSSPTLNRKTVLFWDLFPPSVDEFRHVSLIFCYPSSSLQCRRRDSFCVYVLFNCSSECLLYALWVWERIIEIFTPSNTTRQTIRQSQFSSFSARNCSSVRELYPIFVLRERFTRFIVISTRVRGLPLFFLCKLNLIREHVSRSNSCHYP